VPTYQYACVDCDEQLEVVQSFTDEPLRECPTCRGRLRKVFSPVGVVFKGSGFYRTDSRSGQGSRSAAKSDGKSGDSKSGDSKSGNGKSGDSGSGAGKADSSSSGSKSGDGKSGGSGSSGSSGSSSSSKSESAA